MQIAGPQHKKVESTDAKDVPVFPKQIALFVLVTVLFVPLGHVE